MIDIYLNGIHDWSDNQLWISNSNILKIWKTTFTCSKKESHSKALKFSFITNLSKKTSTKLMWLPKKYHNKRNRKSLDMTKSTSKMRVKINSLVRICKNKHLNKHLNNLRMGTMAKKKKLSWWQKVKKNGLSRKQICKESEGLLIFSRNKWNDTANTSNQERWSFWVFTSS